MNAFAHPGAGPKTWVSVPDAGIEAPIDVIAKIDATTIRGSDPHILNG